MGPKGGEAKGGLFDLGLGPSRYDWGDLTEIASKDDDLASEWSVVFCNVLESAVDGLENMLVHHWGLIPDEEGSIAYAVGQVALYVNVAGTVTIDVERDLEGGVCSATSMED